jgi:hypothetical protein
VGADQVAVGWALVVALLALAVYYGWRQLRLMRQLRGSADPGSVEALYLRARARRRLRGSALMLLLAAQLAGAMIFLEGRAQRQADQADARAGAREQGEEPPPPTPEERSFFRFYTAYWVGILLVLLGMVLLALGDLWATRSFGLRAHRQLQAERREMINRQIARLRQEKQERNGHD